MTPKLEPQGHFTERSVDVSAPENLRSPIPHELRIHSSMVRATPKVPNHFSGQLRRSGTCQGCSLIIVAMLCMTAPGFELTWSFEKDCVSCY
jgi:hypothetical protein